MKLQFQGKFRCTEGQVVGRSQACRFGETLACLALPVAKIYDLVERGPGIVPNALAWILVYYIMFLLSTRV